MRRASVAAVLSSALIATGLAAAPPVPAKPGAAEQAAIFRAAGFRLKGGEWQSNCGDPGGGAYTPGSIEMVGDINGDGRPEAVVTEGSSYCYGMTGQSFWLMSKQANNGWKLMLSDIGVPKVLKTRGAGGWPDISVGGPGFCFPVMRWDGARYALNRREYEGKRCSQ